MGQANCCCGSREALSDTEPVLSADVRLTRGRKRSERRLLLLQEDLLIAKLQRGSTLRPQLRLPLDQLWVLSGGKKVVRVEEEEEDEDSDEDGSCLIFIWDRGSCVAHFGSQALKELWMSALLGTTEESKRPRVTHLPTLKLVEKELNHRHAGRTFNTRSLQRLMERQAKADPKEGPLPAPSGNGGELRHLAGEFCQERQPPASGVSVLTWPLSVTMQDGQPKGGCQLQKQGHQHAVPAGRGSVGTRSLWCCPQLGGGQGHGCPRLSHWLSGSSKLETPSQSCGSSCRSLPVLPQRSAQLCRQGRQGRAGRLH
ncbi:uncharacterized protein LOC110360834 [Columba livia]|uniref:uncharacterized protein LOC110360834 n=1 Tax=Columba livia TaxID=8932 RepID=UPI0031BAC6BA